MKLYKKTALFLGMFLLITAAFPFAASAYYDSSLDSYSYFGKETVTSAPAAYSFDREISAKTLGVVGACEISDIKYSAGQFYLLDKAGGRVIILSDTGELKKVIADNIGLSARNYKDYLLLGGGGHRTGKQQSNWDLLRDIAKEYFPEGQERYFWATQDCMSLDKRPYIGHYSKNTPDLFVATGFSKWGMTGSMLSAMVLSDLVQEKENEYASIFSTSRNILKPQLISNLGHALVGIGRIGGKRCSHMGCVLQWNEKEQAWECPCHGSRFSADGKVLDNPACDELKKKH